MAPNIDRGAISDEAHLAKGKRGLVSLATLREKRVVVKRKNPAAAVNTLAHEAAMLKIVNEHGIGPLFLSYDGAQLVMEFVDGEIIGDWLQRAEKRQIKRVLLDILAQCRTLDRVGINKLEMTHPHKHIIVRKGKPIFIDFERCRKAERPKNVTQVCQWLTSKEISALLAAKNISIPRETMLAHAKQYKQAYSSAVYAHMQEVIGNA